MMKHKSACPEALEVLQHTMMEQNGRLDTLYRLYCPSCKANKRISKEDALKRFRDVLPTFELNVEAKAK